LKGFHEMKKKKTAKKQTMPEFQFKEFTPEEDRIYSEAVGKFKEAVAAGKTLGQAYETYAIEDEELKSLVQADFLKILVAERHFGQRQQPRPDRYGSRRVPGPAQEHPRPDAQKSGVTAAAQAGQQVGDLAPKTDTDSGCPSRKNDAPRPPVLYLASLRGRLGGDSPPAEQCFIELALPLLFLFFLLAISFCRFEN
jgi:hypothetical protein